MDIKSTVESGFYDTPFYFELESKNNATIYYTLDGTDPLGANARKYEAPIYISDRTGNENILSSVKESVIIESYYIPAADDYVPKGTVIRAIAIDHMGRKSEELNLAFFVGLDEEYYKQLPTVSIIMDPNDLISNDRGIYVSGDIWDKEKDTFDKERLYSAPANWTQKGSRWERDARIVFIDQLGEESTEKIRISIHGGSSTQYNQKSFNLLSLSDENKLSQIYGSDSLLLRQGGNDLFNTQIKDRVNQMLIQDRSVRIQRGIPVQVFINGEYWGIYWLQERIDKEFISSYYGVDKNRIVVIKNTKVVEGNDRRYEEWQKVVDYAKSNDLSEPQCYERIKEMIDIQSYMDYMCFEIYVQNLDCISNNIAMWRTDYIDAESEYADMRWRFIIFDTDSSAKDAKMDSFIENTANVTPMEDELFTALLDNDEFRKEFIANFLEMEEENFNANTVEDMVSNIVGEIYPAVIASHLRWKGYDNYDASWYDEDIRRLILFYKERPQYINRYLYEHIKAKE